MKWIYNLMIVMSALLFCNCEGLVEDLDASKLPKVESKLVVSCFISPQSSFMNVIVSESQPLLGPATYSPMYVPNAEVILSGEAGQIRLPYRDSVNQYYVDSSAFKIIAGQSYTLTVNDGKRSVKATCTVPVKVPKIKNIVIEYLPEFEFIYLGMLVRALWADIPGEKNYYSLRGYFNNSITYLDAMSGDLKPVRRNDITEFRFLPAINNLFNDENLDGTTFASQDIQFVLGKKETIVYRDKNNVEHSFNSNPRVDVIHLEVMNLDENYYQFLKTRADYKEDNKFTEPTPVFTNVEGGLGCFGAYNAAIFEDRTGW
ncbi:DUF4249 domain-containing protein [Dyadobacter luticola]|uniref:DUF4249 domain-containing protein n=1 Tax=Dyadobacter luticola TaxID=1979387 RepID=A0A5R9KZI5_9BACT|nr:DUF4249 domain-containing protein [Dyadobacter luticola]TLV01500.1 DUF4249 domain-containing protein [Dyadobacter luticola]